jgi:hypothetical protein
MVHSPLLLGRDGANAHGREAESSRAILKTGKAVDDLLEKLARV